MKTQISSGGHSTPRARGFTLVEVLVVVAIIAILVGISFSGFIKYRKAADKAAVLGNIRALQVANAIYASENNGAYIKAFSFDKDEKLESAWHMEPEFLRIFTGNPDVKGSAHITGVPHSSLDPAVVRAKKYLWDQVEASYGYNQGHMPPGWPMKSTSSTYKASSLTDPARTFSFISCTDWNAKFTGRYLWEGAKAVEGKTPDGKIAFRHDGKAAVVYFDGHVELISKADMKRIDKSNKNGGSTGNIFWDGDLEDGR